jgi:hypothetical protein
MCQLSLNMPSTSSGRATPSATTASDSRLMAAQTRLKMKPVLSFLASNGNTPNSGRIVSSASSSSREVSPSDMRSTALAVGGM